MHDQTEAEIPNRGGKLMEPQSNAEAGLKDEKPAKQVVTPKQYPAGPDELC